jgi:hypothetical protein
MRFVYLLLAFSLVCKDIDDKKRVEDTRTQTNLLFLLLKQEREKGNCLRVSTTSTGKTVSCDRRPSGLCNSNELILTTNERNNLLLESGNFTRDNSFCTFSFGFSGIISLSVQSFSQIDDLNARNQYYTVGSCESEGFTITTPLINADEYQFLQTAKGRIGIAADQIVETPTTLLATTLPPTTNFTQIKTDARNCLNIPFSKSEVDLIQGIRSSTRLRSISCQLGTNCPSSLDKYR